MRTLSGILQAVPISAFHFTRPLTTALPARCRPKIHMSSSKLQAHAKPVKLVLIGDVHHSWCEADALALKHLEPDIALFVGDFGEEVVELVQAIKQQVDAHNIPAAYILGNHDAWHSLHKKHLQGRADPLLAGVQAQLDILGEDHVGYSSKSFPEQGISVVGGRPFSAGGKKWDRAARFNHLLYGLDSVQASAGKIADTISQQPAEHAVVLMAHNGPAGVGAAAHDICGKDWSDKAGDHGDPDLQAALQQAAASGRAVPLVVFGHMHHMLKGGTRRRNMVHIDAKTGTVLLNCAVVPRLTHRANSSTLHHFTTVDLAHDGKFVEHASHVWVLVKGTQCQTAVKEDLVQTKLLKDGKLTRICLHTTGSSKVPVCPDFDSDDPCLQQVTSNV